jgi:hypothetical protein
MCSCPWQLKHRLFDICALDMSAPSAGAEIKAANTVMYSPRI